MIACVIDNEHLTNKQLHVTWDNLFAYTARS